MLSVLATILDHLVLHSVSPLLLVSRRWTLLLSLHTLLILLFSIGCICRSVIGQKTQFPRLNEPEIRLELLQRCAFLDIVVDGTSVGEVVDDEGPTRRVVGDSAGIGYSVTEAGVVKADEGGVDGRPASRRFLGHLHKQEYEA